MMKRLQLSLAAACAALALATAALASKPMEKTSVTPSPALPAIRALKLEPASLTLTDGRDARRVLVWAETAQGRMDVTHLAVFKAASAHVEVDGENYIQPRKAGAGAVTVTAAGKSARLAVKVVSAEMSPVRFVRDVQPVLSKAGCNSGPCHGSAQGKNGFKLSLRGYDPDFDYQALINDISGRRFNRVAVDESLMLLKPLGDVPHEGRQAIKPGSRQHALLRDWIASGTPNEDVTNRATRLEVLPVRADFDLPGRAQQLIVTAHYADGMSRDVTREVIFSSNDPEIVKVNETGQLTSVRRGEAAVLVKYEGLFAANEVTIMGDRTGFVWKQPEEFNEVDRHVHAKLKARKILPSELCSDAEFLRRLHIDLTGQPPTAERTRVFLADTTPSRAKRETLVDELIGSRDYLEFWANKWADLLQCSSETLGQKGVWAFRGWIRDSLAANKPYDQFVRELIAAEGSSFFNPEVNYLRALREPGKMTEDISQTFLGVRFNCNKCHDHPFEKWTQNQYYEFGAYFARVGIKRGTLGRDRFRNNASDGSEKVAEEIVYVNYKGGEVQHPKSNKDVAAKVPFGSAKPANDEADRREAFTAWLTSKENPLFAKSYVNRIWSYMMGRGIIDPVDDIRASNPASNAPLLDALTEDFVKGGFDTRRLLRTIVTSRAYQLSIARNKWNEDDTVNFSRYTPRRLGAEQMLDAVGVATGFRPKFKDLPAGFRAAEIPDGLTAGSDFLTLFGKPKRLSACECERSSNVSLAHAMNLINGSAIGDAVAAPANRIEKLVTAEKDNAKLVEELYVAILNRLPTTKETGAVDFGAGTNRLEVAQDLAWALLNSPAFLFNR